MKIRYFGFLSHKNKKEAVALIRKLIDTGVKLPEKIKETINEMMLRLTGTDITCCPKCKKGTILKGSKAYGCSDYKNGCDFVFPFEKLRKLAADNKLTKELVYKIISNAANWVN